MGIDAGKGARSIRERLNLAHLAKIQPFPKFKYPEQVLLYCPIDRKSFMKKARIVTINKEIGRIERAS